jgi:hypothetical protein
LCIPLALAVGAISAAGALTQGVQGMMAASYESRVAQRNAQMEVDRARDSIDRGRGEARDFYRNLGALKGQQTASMAANGVDLGFGTPLTVQQDTQAGADEDASNLYRNINERTKGFEINASNYRAEAAAARQKGKAALVNSVVQAGTSLMGGFQQQSLMSGFKQQAALRDNLGLGKPRTDWYNPFGR